MSFKKAMSCCHTQRQMAVLKADIHTVRKRKPHRTVRSPALCGLKLLCELSQARAGKREQRKTKEKEDGISDVRLSLAVKKHASVCRRIICTYSLQSNLWHLNSTALNVYQKVKLVLLVKLLKFTSKWKCIIPVWGMLRLRALLNNILSFTVRLENIHTGFSGHRWQKNILVSFYISSPLLQWKVVARGDTGDATEGNNSQPWL